MTDSINPAAPHHLAWFITAPGQTDVLFNVTIVFLIVVVLAVGNFYFQLHALPEQMAHKSANKVQMQLVAVLALLALFTHNNVLWVAALLLALVRLPDFSTPIFSMARSLDKLAGGDESALLAPDPGAGSVAEQPTQLGKSAEPLTEEQAQPPQRAEPMGGEPSEPLQPTESAGKKDTSHA